MPEFGILRERRIKRQKKDICCGLVVISIASSPSQKIAEGSPGGIDPAVAAKTITSFPNRHSLNGEADEDI